MYLDFLGSGLGFLRCVLGLFGCVFGLSECVLGQSGVYWDSVVCVLQLYRDCIGLWVYIGDVCSLYWVVWSVIVAVWHVSPSP